MGQSQICCADKCGQTDAGKETEPKVLQIYECQPCCVYSCHWSGADVQTEAAVLWLTSVGTKGYFPLFAVWAPHVRALGRMRPHEELRGTQQLVEWCKDDGLLIFVSHQWTAFVEPDHTNIQYETLATLLDDVEAMSRLIANAVPQGLYQRTPQSKRLREEQVRRGISVVSQVERSAHESFVWLDYWSIPQASHREQSLAIQSIPAYVTSATLMLVVVPRVEHADTAERCDFTSWKERGWCRLEWVNFCLNQHGSERIPRICVLQELGGEPRMEGMTMSWGLRSPSCAVDLGAFSCCQRGHVGAHGKAVPCDKPAVAHVMETIEDGVANALLTNRDLAAWRRLRSTRWARLSGRPREDSLHEFLFDLRIEDAAAPLEGGMYPLHYAAYANNILAVRGLLELRAELECRDPDRFTPLHLAAWSGALLAVSALLGARADVHAASGWDGSPLALASMSGHFEAVSLLLEHRADVAVELKATHPVPPLRSTRPLHLAAYAHAPQRLVDLLIEAGADPGARVGEGSAFAGCTPAEIAARRGHELVFG